MSETVQKVHIDDSGFIGCLGFVLIIFIVVYLSSIAGDLDGICKNTKRMADTLEKDSRK